MWNNNVNSGVLKENIAMKADVQKAYKTNAEVIITLILLAVLKLKLWNSANILFCTRKFYITTF